MNLIKAFIINIDILRLRNQQQQQQSTSNNNVFLTIDDILNKTSNSLVFGLFEENLNVVLNVS